MRRLLSVRSLVVAISLATAGVVAMSASDALAQAAPIKYQVFFEWNKDSLTPDARKTLAAAADEFKRTGVVRIETIGHTDTTGPKDYNLRLSLRRANNVKAELVRLGVPGNIITTQGVGFSQLLVPTPPGVRELKNRRVEIIATTRPVAAAPAPAPAPAPVAAPPPAPAYKWSVSLGPWYGFNIREVDPKPSNNNTDRNANLLGPNVRIGYNVTPAWQLYIDGVGYNTLGTSLDDGYGGRGVFGFKHIWNLGKFHPSIGPQVGYIGGKGTQDGIVVGPELGLEYDLSNTMFLYARAGYNHNFRNDFGQGIPNGGLGMGLRF